MLWLQDNFNELENDRVNFYISIVLRLVKKKLIKYSNFLLSPGRSFEEAPINIKFMVFFTLFFFKFASILAFIVQSES